jgi:hypothetical protein
MVHRWCIYHAPSKLTFVVVAARLRVMVGLYVDSQFFACMILIECLVLTHAYCMCMCLLYRENTVSVTLYNVLNCRMYA